MRREHAAEAREAREGAYAEKAAVRKAERSAAERAAFKEATAANRERVAQLDEKRKKSDAKKNDRLAEMGVLRR